MILETISRYANLGKEACRIERYQGKDGRIDMCKGIRDLMDESRSEGREEGREEGIRNIIINMLKKEKTIEEICDLAECDPAYVESIRNEIHI